MSYLLMRVVAFILSYLGTTLIYFSLLAGIFGHAPLGNYITHNNINGNENFRIYNPSNRRKR